MPGQPDRPRDGPLLGLLRHPRLLISAALGGIVGLSWLYLIDIAQDMAAMDPTMTMPPMSARDLVLLLAMRWVMMAGMMLPSAAPMILTFASINQRRRQRGQLYVPTALFTAGYLAAFLLDERAGGDVAGDFRRADDFSRAVFDGRNRRDALPI